MRRVHRYMQLTMVLVGTVTVAGQRSLPAALPRFAVASVKPNTSDTPASSRFPLGPGDAYVAGTAFTVTNMPLSVYIRFAFGRSQGEPLPLPSWATQERFDVQARATGEPTKDDMRLMVRALLADRFKMAWHVEQREQSVFALVLATAAKVGPHLTPHSSDEPCAPGAAGERDPKFAAIPCGSPGLVSAFSAGHSSIYGRAEPVARLAATLSNNSFAGIDRIVLDRTGLTGNFDFTLEWAMPLPPADPGARVPVDDSGPSLGTALREQLGLALRSTRALVEVPVIDHIERPDPD